MSLTLLFKQGLTLRTSSIHCCQSSDRWHSIDQRSLTVSICRLRFCAMRDRGESLGSSADLSVSYSSMTLRPESRARSTTNRLTFSLPLNAWRRKWEQSAPCYEHLNSLLDGNPETGIFGFPSSQPFFRRWWVGADNGTIVLIKPSVHTDLVLSFAKLQQISV